MLSVDPASSEPDPPTSSHPSLNPRFHRETRKTSSSDECMVASRIKVFRVLALFERLGTVEELQGIKETRGVSERR